MIITTCIDYEWDVDNKFIKPIADALILSKVIQDDNMTKMSYCVKGAFSEIPHTEIYVFDSKNMNEFSVDYTISTGNVLYPDTCQQPPQCT